MDSSLGMLLHGHAFGSAVEKEPTVLQTANIWVRLARLRPGAVKSDRSKQRESRYSGNKASCWQCTACHPAVRGLLAPCE